MSESITSCRIRKFFFAESCELLYLQTLRKRGGSKSPEVEKLQTFFNNDKDF